MVQSATAIAAKTAENHRSSGSSQAPDNDFMSVLRSSVSNKTEKSDRDTVTASKNGDQGEYENAVRSDQDSNKETNKATETNNDKDPVATLSQIIDSMTATARQMINNPKPKDASAMMEALFGKASVSVPEGVTSIFSGQGSAAQAGAELAALAGAGSEALSQTGDSRVANGQFALLSTPGEDTQENNPATLFSRLTANAAAATGKATGNNGSDMNNNANMSQGNNANSAFQMDEDAVNLLGNAEITASKNAGAFDEISSLLKTEALASRSGDSKEPAGLAALFGRSVNTQDVSTQATQRVQETIPAGRISAIDEVISKAINNGQNDIVIRINPPDLGSVHIRLSLDNGVLKADVKVDSAAVKDTFLTAMPQIKNALENSGIKASEFNVDVRDDQEQGRNSGNNQAKQQQRQDGEAGNAFSDFFA